MSAWEINDKPTIANLRDALQTAGHPAPADVKNKKELNAMLHQHKVPRPFFENDTKEFLREGCDEHGIVYDEKMNKQQLLEKLAGKHKKATVDTDYEDSSSESSSAPPPEQAAPQGNSIHPVTGQWSADCDASVSFMKEVMSANNIPIDRGARKGDLAQALIDKGIAYETDRKGKSSQKKDGKQPDKQQPDEQQPDEQQPDLQRANGQQEDERADGQPGSREEDNGTSEQQHMNASTGLWSGEKGKGGNARDMLALVRKRGWYEPGMNKNKAALADILNANKEPFVGENPVSALNVPRILGERTERTYHRHNLRSRLKRQLSSGQVVEVEAQEAQLHSSLTSDRLITTISKRHRNEQDEDLPHSLPSTKRARLGHPTQPHRTDSGKSNDVTSPASDCSMFDANGDQAGHEYGPIASPTSDVSMREDDCATSDQDGVDTDNADARKVGARNPSATSAHKRANDEYCDAVIRALMPEGQRKRVALRSTKTIPSDPHTGTVPVQEAWYKLLRPPDQDEGFSFNSQVDPDANTQNEAQSMTDIDMEDTGGSNGNTEVAGSAAGSRTQTPPQAASASATTGTDVTTHSSTTAASASAEAGSTATNTEIQDSHMTNTDDPTELGSALRLQNGSIKRPSRTAMRSNQNKKGYLKLSLKQPSSTTRVVALMSTVQEAEEEYAAARSSQEAMLKLLKATSCLIESASRCCTPWKDHYPEPDRPDGLKEAFGVLLALRIDTPGAMTELSTLVNLLNEMIWNTRIAYIDSAVLSLDGMTRALDQSDLNQFDALANAMPLDWFEQQDKELGVVSQWVERIKTKITQARDLRTYTGANEERRRIAEELRHIAQDTTFGSCELPNISEWKDLFKTLLDEADDSLTVSEEPSHIEFHRVEKVTADGSKESVPTVITSHGKVDAIQRMGAGHRVFLNTGSEEFPIYYAWPGSAFSGDHKKDCETLWNDENNRFTKGKPSLEQFKTMESKFQLVTIGNTITYIRFVDKTWATKTACKDIFSEAEFVTFVAGLKKRKDDYEVQYKAWRQEKPTGAREQWQLQEPPWVAKSGEKK